MKAVRWVWYPYLPGGKITIFDGDPGRGKSMITIDLAVRTVTGTAMPDGGVVVKLHAPSTPPRGVVMICAEDDWSDTILPRMTAAVESLKPSWTAAQVREALDRVAVVGMKRDEDNAVIPLEFPRDANRVHEAIAAVGASLVVVDPIMAFFGKTTQTGIDASIRAALGPFKELAGETGAGFVLIRHLNKSVDLKAEYRGGGSHGGFIGLARSAWMVGRHPEEDGQFVFVHSKANITVTGRSLMYVIESRSVTGADGESLDAAGIAWRGGIDMDVDTLLREHDSRNDAPVRDECWAVMCALFDEQDPRAVGEMEKMLKAAGFSADVIKRTKKHYGVRSVRRYGDNKKIDGWDWTREPGEGGLRTGGGDVG